MARFAGGGAAAARAVALVAAVAAALAACAAAYACECTCCTGAGCTPVYRGSVEVASCSDCGIDLCRATVAGCTGGSGSTASFCSSSSGTSIGVIIGCIVGAVILIGIVIGFLLWRKKRAEAASHPESAPLSKPVTVVYAPNTGYYPPPQQQQQAYPAQGSYAYPK